MKQGSIGTGKKVAELLGYRNGENWGETNSLLVFLLSPVFSASNAALSSVCGLVDDLTIFRSSFLQGNRHSFGAAILCYFSHLAYKVMGSNMTSSHMCNKARAYIVLISFPP